jgi:hypothetical protein
MTSENTISYALKVITPLLSGEASQVEVKADAERWHACRRFRKRR